MMKFKKISSHAKINISLNLIKKLSSGYHQIETITTFLKLEDHIFIKPINKNNHKIIFIGKFSDEISKKNTITKLLDILDKEKKLNNKKFYIKIKKNIPCKAGLGGGSINAGSILKYFSENNIINCDKKNLIRISNLIGSDVIFGIQSKKLILLSKNKIYRSKKKLNYYVVLIKPSFGCSSKEIYQNVNSYSNSTFLHKYFKKPETKVLKNMQNDLEISAFKIYPALAKIKNFMLKIKRIKFARMTGSGSTMIGYFKRKKDAQNAQKLLKKKYKNYWCILSKTI